MKRVYEELVLNIVLHTEEAVRCSNTFEVGDDTKEDIFE